MNGFGVIEPKIKKNLIKEFIMKFNVDIFAMAEVNVNWRLVKKKEGLKELCRDWFKNSREHRK